jgi:hypothetical protein
MAVLPLCELLTSYWGLPGDAFATWPPAFAGPVTFRVTLPSVLPCDVCHCTLSPLDILAIPNSWKNAAECVGRPRQLRLPPLLSRQPAHSIRALRGLLGNEALLPVVRRHRAEVLTLHKHNEGLRHCRHAEELMHCTPKMAHGCKIRLMTQFWFQPVAECFLRAEFCQLRRFGAHTPHRCVAPGASACRRPHVGTG